MRRALVVPAVGLMSAAIVVLAAAAPASAGSSQYPPRAATCASAPSAGAPGVGVSLRGTNWAPSTTVSISFVQDGSSTTLATAPVDAQGKFSIGATIPATAQRGRASIVVTGTAINGATVTCTTNFQVVDPHGASATLPEPGAPLTSGVLLAGIGLLFGATALGRGRRRSRRPDVKR